MLSYIYVSIYLNYFFRNLLVKQLLRQAFQRRVRVKRVALQVEGLEPMVEQLAALDRIRQRFGGTAVTWGMLRTSSRCTTT